MSNTWDEDGKKTSTNPIIHNTPNIDLQEVRKALDDYYKGAGPGKVVMYAENLLTEVEELRRIVRTMKTGSKKS